MQEFKIEEKDKILILAPHPDDESIGCGALLEKYSNQCDVVLLTDGSKGNPEWSESYTRRIRRKEFLKAMKYANVSKAEMINVKDGELTGKRKVLNTIEFTKYKYIFCPNKNEDHPDHYATFRILQLCLRRKGYKEVYICQYEVWTPIVRPTHYIEHTNEFKNELIGMYESQVKHIDYQKLSAGLGSYRSAAISKESPNLNSYAEVYDIKIICRL